MTKLSGLPDENSPHDKTIVVNSDPDVASAPQPVAGTASEQTLVPSNTLADGADRADRESERPPELSSDVAGKGGQHPPVSAGPAGLEGEGDTLPPAPASVQETIIGMPPEKAASVSSPSASDDQTINTGKVNQTEISPPDSSETAATFIAEKSDPNIGFSIPPSALGATEIKSPEVVAQKGMEKHFETLDAVDSSGKSSVADTRIIGDYQVLGELGRGGMGVVYKARHRKLNRDVALKMILVGKYSSGDALKRFVAEARAVAHLQHPGIVQIFDIGEHQNLPYFSLEFVDGTDLQKELVRQPRTPRQAAEIVHRLCETMQYAHDNKILHRDLKPANVLISTDGALKITDFGLAKQVDTEGSTDTSDGTVMGSPSYMPPEQARGELSSVTPRSDLYSLGAILYQMLTGRPPFLTDSAIETVMQVINNDPVTPRDMQPSVPVDLETICMKSLQKDAAARYGSCQEMADDLQRFLNGEPILARPISKLERAVRWCRRNPTVAIPSMLAGVLLMATALISTWAWSTTSAQAAIIATERDNAQEERDNANTQRGIAEEQRTIAVANEEKAIEQQQEAEKQRRIAEEQRAIAIVNEENAIKEQQEAERQRLLAREAQLQAEKNQQLAESQAKKALENIQLIITEVDDRIAKEAGTTELRIDLLTMVEKRCNELDLALVGGIRGEAIPTLMTIRFKIAKAWLNLDKLEEANATFEKIYEMAQQRILDKGRIDATRYNLAMICLEWATLRERLTGDPASKEKLLQEALAELRDIIAHPLSDPTATVPGPVKFEVAFPLQGTLLQLGSGAKKLGQLDQASEYFSEAGDVCQAILDDIQNDADWVKQQPANRIPVIRQFFSQNSDIARSSKANILCMLGKAEQAVPVYLAVIEDRRTEIADNPDDLNAKDQLANQLRNFGQYMVLVGRVDQGAAAMAESLLLSETLYEADPKNASYKRSFGHGLYYLAMARDLQKQTDEATVLLERSRVVRSEMVAVSDDKNNSVNLMLTEARMGNAMAAQALIEKLSAGDAKDADLHLDIARALAQLYRYADDDAKTELLDAAIAALNKAVADGLQDAFLIEKQPDLYPIQNDQRFVDLIQQLQNR